jgi:hypothetical protein
LEIGRPADAPGELRDAIMASGADEDPVAFGTVSTDQRAATIVDDERLRLGCPTVPRRDRPTRCARSGA